MTPESQRKNVFVGVEEEAVRQITALGVSPHLIEPLRVEFGKLALDNVTGFHEGRSGGSRLSTLHNAIRHVKETLGSAFYVEMDLQNLSGLNSELGHTAANVVFKHVAGIIRSVLSPVAGEAVFFRHGGDEMSAFLIESSETAVRTAMETVQAFVRTLAKDSGLDQLPHPKHPGDVRWSGIGVHYGICRLTVEHEADPTLVFQSADSELEGMKRSKFAGSGEVSENRRAG